MNYRSCSRLLMVAACLLMALAFMSPAQAYAGYHASAPHTTEATASAHTGAPGAAKADFTVDPQGVAVASRSSGDHKKKHSKPHGSSHKGSAHYAYTPTHAHRVQDRGSG